MNFLMYIDNKTLFPAKNPVSLVELNPHAAPFITIHVKPIKISMTCCTYMISKTFLQYNMVLKPDTSFIQLENQNQLNKYLNKI